MSGNHGAHNISLYEKKNLLMMTKQNVANTALDGIEEFYKFYNVPM